MKRSIVLMTCATVAIMLTLGAAPPPDANGRVTEDFSADPQWESHHSRLVPTPAPITEQNFGYSPTHHAGGKAAGEIGGRVHRSVTPAWYAKPIATKTLNDKLKASGKFSVTSDNSSAGTMIGWFNDKSRGWRTPNSLTLRIDGNGSKYWVLFESCTRNWLAAGKGCFEGEAYQKTPTKPFKADGTPHEWTIEYDPAGAAGKGNITVTLDGTTYSLDLPPGFKADGAEFNRFGMINVMAGGSWQETWFDDLTVDGQLFDFTADPKWEGNGNRVKFEDRALPGKHDYGYCATTDFAGGAKPGEIGGMIWRGEEPSYYAAKTEKLSLDDELFASGKLAFTGAGSDSGVYFGWFDAASTAAMDKPEHAVARKNNLAIMLEGPSRIGHYFRPSYFNSHGHGSRKEDGPIIRPDGQVHTWSMHYKPNGAGGNGQIVFRLDDVEQTLDLRPGTRKEGATFDRFGFFNIMSGGRFVNVFVDDLTYTAAPAAAKR
jgi:hypothetical protein